MDETKQIPEENVSNPDTTASVTETGEPPKEKLYTQAEVDEIVLQSQDALLRQAAQNLDPAKRQTVELEIREFNMDRNLQLKQRLQSWCFGNYRYRKIRSGMAGMFQNNYTGEYDDSADKFAEQLIGLWEAAEMDSFKRAVDGLFDLLDVANNAGYRQAEFEAQEQKDKDSVVKKPEKRDLMEEIFKKGGRF